MMKTALSKQKQNIVQQQVAAGREFKVIFIRNFQEKRLICDTPCDLFRYVFKVLL